MCAALVFRFDEIKIRYIALDGVDFACFGDIESSYFSKISPSIVSVPIDVFMVLCHGMHVIRS